MSRREQILDHTNALIQDVGYKGFSYADLSKALGITKASIHHHFPTKEDLGIAYCESKLEALGQFRETLRPMTGSWQKLSAYMDIFKSCKDGKMCGINAMQSDSGDMPDALVTKVRQASEAELEILTEILTEGRAAKDMQFSGAPYEQAILVSSALKGALLIARMKKDDSFDRVCNALRKTLEY